ncbi:MAG: 4-(cytidine 5'-diphospho)-2-C-methyl-D-erythritol kinase [Salinivirgaceae bacterium]|jgi:4-diphosphocytidyl-2-C-methyl-D-erythritol kinase|nr:4-(cytidine 5'-diphospho)-2-C-methyl-D-erythritol kinase [Salinivirgaceae bacterium]
MVVFPNAKINLGLHVTKKRPDGFHEIESVMYAIPFSDILEILPAQTTTVKTTGLVPDDCPTENNLIYKAWQLMHRQYKIPSVAMRLHKNIPSGAGLGGGSADAAFTITTLNSLFDLKLASKEMEELAAELGSDCPFFIKNTPSLATGRGNILSPINISLRGYYLLLVVPKLHISTPEAYGGITPKKPKNRLCEIISEPCDTWKSTLVNDFENHLFLNHPKLHEIKQTLYAMGASYASMSGSGSAIYGLFNQTPEQRQINDLLSDHTSYSMKIG